MQCPCPPPRLLHAHTPKHAPTHLDCLGQRRACHKHLAHPGRQPILHAHNLQGAGQRGQGGLGWPMWLGWGPGGWVGNTPQGQAGLGSPNPIAGTHRVHLPWILHNNPCSAHRAHSQISAVRLSKAASCRMGSDPGLPSAPTCSAPAHPPGDPHPTPHASQPRRQATPIPHMQATTLPKGAWFSSWAGNGEHSGRQAHSRAGRRGGGQLPPPPPTH